MSQEIFKRVEKKYILNQNDYDRIMNYIVNNLIPDPHGFSTICNIYFDTKDYKLIRNSLEKPLYKEKIRLRSYGIPTLDSKVFLEIKKKFNGTVYKRRVLITLNEYYSYINKDAKPNCNEQIMNEMDYCFKNYELVPSLYLAYDRMAYYGIIDKDFRITFDFNIRSRKENLSLEFGDNGDKLLDNNIFIMEIKTSGSIPLSFVKVLSNLKIYPISFSKYGEVFKRGEMSCLIV